MKKKLLLLSIVLLLMANVQAQVHYGVKAGVNLGKYAYEDNLSIMSVNTIKVSPSFYVTGYADLSIARNFSIQPGVSLQGKGSRAVSRLEEVPESISNSRNILSIEIPLNAVYYIPTGSSGSVFVGAGPYVGYAINGRSKMKWSGIDIGDVGGGVFDSSNGTSSRDIDFSGDDKEMKRFDAGINFLVGYKLSNGLLINAGYGLGLTNLSAQRKIKLPTKYSNRVLSFGVGLQF